ncbi:MAG: M20/M25/M40 family metallo-hydrolase, partial [Pseudomonadota bacterium]
ATPFDHGTEAFQATNLEVTSVDVGNSAFNVIPARASARFNVRFNDTWTADTIKVEIERRLEAAAVETQLREEGRAPVRYQVSYTDRPSHVFLTRDAVLISSLSSAIQMETGHAPDLSTGGGTSDARFIKDVCPVVEFGLVGQTMHQVDERVALSDLAKLTNVYRRFIETYFSGSAQAV